MQEEQSYARWLWGRLFPTGSKVVGDSKAVPVEASENISNPRWLWNRLFPSRSMATHTEVASEKEKDTARLIT